MKKLLISILFLVLANTIFAQDISAPKPILATLTPNGDWVDFNYDLVLGCGVENFQVEARWTDVGSTTAYTVEAIPFRPKPYLRTLGTTVLDPDGPGFKLGSLTDDQWSPIIDLTTSGSTLDFRFFGNARSQFVISSNGLMSFDTSYAGGYSDWVIQSMGKIDPNANFANDPIEHKDSIIQMHDTNPGDADAEFDSYAFWSILGAPGERYFIMATHNMPMFACGGDYGMATHQMIFYETTNIIEFHIQDKPICFSPSGSGTSWANGWMAMGMQNADRTVGIAPPGRDNQDQYQILQNTVDTDGDSIADQPAAWNPEYPIESPEGWRFIPSGTTNADGSAYIPPSFAWYVNYDHITETGTFVTNNAILSVDASQIPLPANTLTYTAVVTYTDEITGAIYNSTEDVTFTLDDPIVGHIKEFNSTDDTVEFFPKEEINLCENEGYLLEMLIDGYDDTDGVNFQMVWTMDTFGSPTTTLSTDTVITPYTIPTTLSPGTYTFTCTVDHGSCTFSDSVEVRIFDSNTTMDYPAPKVYCANELTNPIPGNLFPQPSATADQAELEEYYFTITNSGVWANPLTSDPTRSLDGEVDLDLSYAAATVPNADGSADFTITYHAHCPNNVVDDTITIRNAPLVLNPEIGDPTATPIIEPSDLIVQCETNTTLHTADFDIPGIEDYIANGIALIDLNIVWSSNTAGIILPNSMPASFNTTSMSVKVTVTDANDPAACAVEYIFNLTVSTKAIIATPTDNLRQCEPDSVNNPGFANFFGADIETVILAGQDPAIYHVEYTAVDTNGDNYSITGPLTTPFNAPELTITAIVTDSSGNCPSDPVFFDIIPRAKPIVTPPTTTNASLILCETNTASHTVEFDTSNWDTLILASNPTPINTDFVIEYDYMNSSGTYITGANSIPNPFISGTQTITIRAKNITAGEVTCNSGDETFDLIVNPKPIEIPQAPVVICSDDTLNVILNNYTTLTGNTYSWIAGDNLNVTGETITANTSTTITDVLNNVSLIDQIVTYTITPTANTTDGGCVGDDFTVDVTVRPEPVGTDTTVPACSDVQASIDLNTITTLSATSINTYSWEAVDNPNVSGETLGVQTGNTITQTLTNTSTTNQNVIYNVTPTSANNCEGQVFTVTINVGVEPVGTDPNLIVCSFNTSQNIGLNIDLDDSVITTLTGNVFSWEVISNTGVTGTSVGVVSTSTITDNLTNITNAPQTVVYKVSPTSVNGCNGNDFNVTVTVNPEPIQIVLVETACSREILTVDLNLHTNLSSNSYTWIAIDNANITGETMTLQNSATITDSLINTTLVPQTVMYTIIPTSSDNCEGESFDIAIIINPEPVGTNTTVPACSDVQASINLNTITTLATTGINTYSWEVVDNPNVSGETLGVQTGNIITQTLTNTSTTNQDVIYNVTPTSANNCEGQVFTVTINVGVEPVGIDPNLITCSFNTNQNVGLNIDLDDLAITTLTGNVFSWEVISNTGVTGTSVGVVSTTTITDNLTNITNAPQTVLYKVSPTSANGCNGNDFNVTVTVNPEPVFPNITPIDICSDIALAIDIDSINTNSLSNITYSWTATANGTVTGFSANGTTSNIVDTITNTSGANVIVTYVITPTSADNCIGETFNIVVTVGDEPKGTNQTPIICSDDSVNLDLNTVVNKAGTSFSWVATDNPNITGETVGASTSSLINDTLNNVSDTVQTVTYTITPTNGCVGNDFTVVVTINPEPVGASPTVPLDACSDVEFIIHLEDYTSMPNLGNTYKWQAINNPDLNVTGETTTLTTGSTITETITNTSDTPQIIVYQITPTSTDGCEGNMFTIEVEVGQNPIELPVTPILTPYCSNDLLNIDLNTFTTLVDNTYSWVATDNIDTNATGDFTVTGETITATAGDFINDTIKNISTTIQTVTYTITPTSANGCLGNAFDIIVTINPEPVANENIEEMACSDVVNNFDLNTYTTLSGNSYVWIATDNPNVTGETLVSTATDHILDTLTNLSTDNQEVIYTVIPTSSNNCVGEAFDIKVTIGVEPVGADQTPVTCSYNSNNDAGLSLDLNTYITNLNTNDSTFSWFADNNNLVNGETTAITSTNFITDQLINTSGSVQYVTYHVTPTSAAPNSCAGNEFTVIVEVGFEPVGTSDIEIFCNEEVFVLNLDSYTTLNGNTYTWHAIDNTNVTGETIDNTTTSSIDNVIVNTTGVLQTVEYLITPSSIAGCVGNEFSIYVDINPRPEFDLKPQYLICPEIGDLVIGEDNNDSYTYHWYEANDLNTIIGYDETLLVSETDLVASNGTYVLTVIDAFGCTYSQFTSVSMAEQMIIDKIHVSDFNRPDNTIVVDVIGGSGNFEYTLTYNDYTGNSQTTTQDDNTFTNLPAGTYQIEVLDHTGCSINVISDDIYVLDYPPFFTPNGDLQHDTWQIVGANLIPNSKIYIFDRFGKVLAKLDPKSVIGWDGTYNGIQVPASDYWFTAEYIDPNTGQAKSVKGNFSIVRK